MDFRSGNSDTMMIDDANSFAVNCVENVLKDDDNNDINNSNNNNNNDTQALQYESEKKKNEKEKELVFPYNCMIRGPELMMVTMKLLQVWLSITTVTPSRVSFDFDAKKYHNVDRTIEFAFKTILENNMFPDEVIYVALSLINKLHQKTGISINIFNTKIIFLTALCLGNKILLDRNYGAINFDYIGGLKNGTIYKFEALFLNSIQWECEVSVDEMVNVISSLHAIRSTMVTF